MSKFKTNCGLAPVYFSDFIFYRFPLVIVIIQNSLKSSFTQCFLISFVFTLAVPSSGIPSNLCFQPNFFWLETQLRSCWLWNVSTGLQVGPTASLAPRANLCLNEQCYFKIICLCLFAYQAGSLTRQQTIDVIFPSSYQNVIVSQKNLCIKKLFQNQ